eukprot:1855207-Amphidinium_carterae.1
MDCSASSSRLVGVQSLCASGWGRPMPQVQGLLCCIFVERMHAELQRCRSALCCIAGSGVYAMSG